MRPSITSGFQRSITESRLSDFAIRLGYLIVMGSETGRKVRHEWQAKVKTCLVRYVMSVKLEPRCKLKNSGRGVPCSGRLTSFGPVSDSNTCRFPRSTYRPLSGA